MTTSTRSHKPWTDKDDTSNDPKREAIKQIQNQEVQQKLTTAMSAKIEDMP
jgi:hypothetical protein